MTACRYCAAGFGKGTLLYNWLNTRHWGSCQTFLIYVKYKSMGGSFFTGEIIIYHPSSEPTYPVQGHGGLEPLPAHTGREVGCNMDRVTIQSHIQFEFLVHLV